MYRVIGLNNVKLAYKLFKDELQMARAVSTVLVSIIGFNAIKFCTMKYIVSMDVIEFFFTNSFLQQLAIIQRQLAITRIIRIEYAKS